MSGAVLLVPVPFLGGKLVKFEAVLLWLIAINEAKTSSSVINNFLIFSSRLDDILWSEFNSYNSNKRSEIGK